MHNNKSSEKSGQRFLDSLEQAIELNDINQVEALVFKNADLVNTRASKYPPLWMAAIRGCHEIVEVLLNSGANLSNINRVQDARSADSGKILGGSNRITILHLMGIKAVPCNDRHIKVGEILVRYGADVNAQNPVNRTIKTPVDYAVVSGNVKWLQFLLSKGALLTQESLNLISTSSFFRFPSDLRIDLLSELLKHGLDVNSKNSDGENLLTLLIRYAKADDPNAVKIAEFLISAGVPIDEVDHCGLTPLHHSVILSNITLASLLLKEGADVNKKNKCHHTPLNYAVGNCEKNMIEFLLSHGADINVKNGNEQTVLYDLNYCMNEEMLNFLLEKGADVCVVDGQNKTPFLVLQEKNLYPGVYGNYNSCITRLIREFSRLTFENIPLMKMDTEKIEANEYLKKYFGKCLAEIRVMPGTKFYEKHSLYSVLEMSKNMKRLAKLSKNEDFVKNFEINLERLRYYKRDLRRIMESAVQLRDRSDAVELKLKYIFGDYLPAVVIRILADDLIPEDLPL